MNDLGSTGRALATRLPTPLRRAMRSVAVKQPVRRLLGQHSPSTPIAEYCSDRFIRSHRGDTCGHVVRLGGTGKEPRPSRRLRHLEVVDRDPYNEAVTFLLDPADADLLPAQSFDCAIVVGTGESPIRGTTLAHAWAALRSGGVMLVTAAGRHEDLSASRLTETELSSLLADEVGIVDADISSIGSPALAVAFANDSPAEDLRARDLRARDLRARDLRARDLRAADLERSEPGSTVMVFARAVKAAL